MERFCEQPQTGAATGYGIGTYPPGATYGPRRMRDWEFVWMLEGDAEYSRDGATFAAPLHSIVLCRPNATDLFRWDTQKRTRHAYFHFGVEYLPGAWPDESTWPNVRLGQPHDLLVPLFRHVLNALMDSGGQLANAPEVRLAMAHMLTLFVRGNQTNDEFPTDQWPDAVERAWNYLHQRLEKAPDAVLSLNEIARAAHTSPEHLCRVFKSATGWTPMEALRLARLDRAATLLARSNYSVGEIAHQCGFASAFHFSRRFKEAYHRSPRELRRELYQGAPPPLPRLRRVRF